MVSGWVLAIASPITLVSVQDEITLGREAQKQVRAVHAGRSAGATAAYVASIGRRLAANAGGPKYPYSFSVANYRDLNAFALPGGPIWVNRGVLQAARTESQAAGVLAHEIAHVAQRHAAQQISKGRHRQRSPGSARRRSSATPAAPGRRRPARRFSPAAT